MYFEFEDNHPDTPRIESGFSRREGVVYSVAAHIALILVMMYAPQIPWIHEATERARELADVTGVIPAIMEHLQRAR